MATSSQAHDEAAVQSVMAAYAGVELPADAIGEQESNEEPVNEASEGGDQLDSLYSAIPEGTSDEDGEVEGDAGSQETSSAESKSAKSKEDSFEYVVATGPKGRQKVKVDYSDKERIKRAHQKAVAADLYRLERDKLAEERKKDAERLETLNKLDALYETKGLAGLVSQFSGKDFREFIREEAAKIDAFESLSPAEQQAQIKEQEVTEKDRKLQEMQRRIEEMEQRSQAARDEAEQKALESLVNPAFERYRMAGQLGDEEHEHMLDTLIWDRAKAKLAAIPDDKPLTRAAVDKAFREEAEKVKALVNKQATQAAKKAAVTRKVAAAESAQVVAKAGNRASSIEEQVQSALKRGDLMKAASLYLSK